MSNAQESDPIQEHRETRWSRIRATFGPAFAGLVGGALLGLVSLPQMSPLCRNMATTYASFPSLDRPSFALNFEVPSWLSVVAVLVGLAGPIAIGAAAIGLARTRDIWADLSAGLSAALAATVSAFVSGVGWAIVLAMVVVPSISDLTILGDAPASERGVQAIADRYPDLRHVEPPKRGQLLMAKIISDQCNGGAQAVGTGILLSGLTIGTLAMSGALAAGYLRRRGESWRTAIAPYLEMTLPTTVTVAMVAAAVLTPAWSVLLGDNPLAVAWPSLAGLAACAALMNIGAIQRWPWMVRLCVGITWLAILIQARHDGVPWHIPVIATALGIGILVKYRNAIQAGWAAMRA
jgi:hypothetical protein